MQESNCALEKRKDSLREALITILLGRRKRFTGQSSLVDGDADFFCETAMVVGRCWGSDGARCRPCIVAVDDDAVDVHRTEGESIRAPLFHRSLSA